MASAGQEGETPGNEALGRHRPTNFGTQVDERPAPPANLVRERNLYRAHTPIIHRYFVPEEVLRWTQQIRKGSTRLAILQLVSERERYGYEIVTSIRNRTNGGLEVAEGNVYPALHALEAEGYVTSTWREVEPGVPPRKYYRITARGREHRSMLVKEWKEYASAIARLLEGE